MWDCTAITSNTNLHHDVDRVPAVYRRFNQLNMVIRILDYNCEQAGILSVVVVFLICFEK